MTTVEIMEGTLANVMDRVINPASAVFQRRVADRASCKMLALVLSVDNGLQGWEALYEGRTQSLARSPLSRGVRAIASEEGLARAELIEVVGRVNDAVSYLVRRDPTRQELAALRCALSQQE